MIIDDVFRLFFYLLHIGNVITSTCWCSCHNYLLHTGIHKSRLPQNQIYLIHTLTDAIWVCLSNCGCTEMSPLTTDISISDLWTTCRLQLSIAVSVIINFKTRVTYSVNSCFMYWLVVTVGSLSQLIRFGILNSCNQMKQIK